ncbi:CHC2 zinc finger domain-containing protein [Mycoplasmopsis alligatoris]|uniref:CHC2 zinc finger domain protein n=1 Tax=Mycoplasmopsis alligatoris A21JP2 TaxID=747682 RepID=D4XVS3_9BACT|nr:CHC2 zinc finger domain-containing protein [Mycoplasmopsis alligatoris]EFF41556.1 CHC2 zinc finger domain protein [Mycoplasmopsis alligatoris A21JP2]
MKNIPEHIINEIIESTDIVALISSFLNLSKKGKDFVGLCPFHGDNTPSMSISSEKQIFKCFSCNVGGNSLNFLMKYKNFKYLEAIKYLADFNGHSFDFSSYETAKNIPKYTKNQELIIETLKAANLLYKNSVYENKDAQEYLKKRMLDTNILDYFNIGFSPEIGIKEKLVNEFNFKNFELNKAGIINSEFNEILRKRITFAITNNLGDIIAFSGRALGDLKPKYINSPETELFKKMLLYTIIQRKNFVI